jgi:hypothetical protein
MISCIIQVWPKTIQFLHLVSFGLTTHDDAM